MFIVTNQLKVIFMEFQVYENIIMPKMGESITEGTIIKWLKKEGDAVNKDENIVLISTDKVEAEIPSPNKGFLVKVKYNEGDTVAVGEVLGAISNEKDGYDNAKDTVISTNNEDNELKSNSHSDENKNSIKSRNDQFLSPLVKKLIQKYNIDETVVDDIKGTGLNNRITKVDILKFINTESNDNKKAVIQKSPNIENRKDIASNKSNISNEFAKNQIVSENIASNIIQKDISNLRKKIMDNMVRSKEISAHVSTFFKVDYSNINAYRKKYMNENGGYKLTYTDFVIASVAKIISRHPYINSEIKNNKLLLKKNINLGVAVAVTDPEPGLLVPVIKNANQLNILGISQQIKYLSKKVRNKKINVDDLSDGTFTITNPGNFGAVTNTPIINQPQVAILGMGTLHKETVVKKYNNVDTISIGLVGWLSLTFDHRVIDGIVADSFMKDLKNDLENWDI
jgi:2-oxoglutarate dehydrogenase E2 component (dihydrolipoamide succinyltransferase)